MTVLTIARMTILEASRRRLLVAQGVLSLIVVALTGLGFHLLNGVNDQGQQIPHQVVQLIASQLLILIMFGFSGVLALGGALSAAPAIAGEIDSGVVLTMAARPVSRGSILVGRWFGVSAMVGGYAALISAAEIGVCWWATGYSPPDAAALILALTAEGVVVVTMALLLSTRLAAMTSGIITLVLFFTAWIGGIAHGVGLFLHNQTLANLGEVSRLFFPSDLAWRGALYAMEPPEAIALAQLAGPAAQGNPFLANVGLGVGEIATIGVWILLALALAVLGFSRREL